MDIKEYISSGIIEMYAVNSLSAQERSEFERMALLYPEIGNELRKVEKTLEDYVKTHAVNPRPQLRQQIIDELIIEDPNKKVKQKAAIKLENYSPTYKYLIAASLAALIVSTYSSWFFYNRWDEAEVRYTTLLNEKNELAQNYNFVKTTFDDALSNLIVLRDENNLVFSLASTDTAADFQARVYWNKENNRTYIDVLALPEPSSGKQFQLWALVSGKPVDAGVFLAGDTNIQRVKDILHADMWAVTLEPQGGSLTPTLDQMYLISKKS